MQNIDRRDFFTGISLLAGTAGLGHAIPAWARGVHGGSAARKGSDVLSGERLTMTVADATLGTGGRHGPAVTINGTLPGPLLHLKEGQKLVVDLVNNSSGDTSIHWHGLLVPFLMDGVPGVTMEAVKPGERFRYEFPIRQAGTYWWHAHTLQEPMGHYGPIVIDPVEPEVRHIMRRYIRSSSANALVEQLERDGVRTKIQHRVSGPHRGGIPFRRGSLFYLLKNPVYRGMIVHKGAAHPGEHEAIVEEQLWDAVQARLAQKAPPRNRPTNDHQDALLRGLITDPHGRSVVPTFSCKGTRRYRYYETRKDIVRADKVPATRFPMPHLDAHIIAQLRQLLGDEHALRRLSGLTDAAGLEGLRKSALNLLATSGKEQIVRTLIKAIDVQNDHLLLKLDPSILMPGNETGEWTVKRPLPKRKPLNEARLRIDPEGTAAGQVSAPLTRLLQEAFQVRELVTNSPDLPLAEIAKREGRCRKQMTKLLKLSWMSPRIIETILEGRQSASLTRNRLLNIELPFEWKAQEQLLRVTG